MFPKHISSTFLCNLYYMGKVGARCMTRVGYVKRWLPNAATLVQIEYFALLAP